MIDPDLAVHRPTMLRTLRSLPSYRPGIAYVLDTLYLAPTARSRAANTMRSCRGPGFADDPLALPISRYSLQLAVDSGFEPPPGGTPEPSPGELARLVDEFYAANGAGDLGSMGELDGGVVFQGMGDPLMATEVVLETVRLVAEKRNGLSFRLNTLGLCDDCDIELLLKSEVVERADMGDRRRETRISCVSVFLPAASPAKYDELLAPSDGRGFRDVCGFVARLSEAGVNVECTAVDRPDVSVPEIERLALGLGARSFRTRSWIE
jgi:hypothetical protein